jgi:tetratricopeptide (TPR) repeat protein
MKIPTRLMLVIATMSLLGACATAPPPMPSAADLFSDASFKAPAQPVRTDQLFALSPAMRAHLNSPLFSAQLRSAGREHGLFDALYKRGDLKLEYDAAVTRDAAATFAAGKGNCLSLVIMTAAFAKALDLRFTFQQVLVEQQWSRNGNMYVASAHVNLSLPIDTDMPGVHTSGDRVLTIDFLPPDDASYFNTVPLDEATVVAMYLNNRAAEELGLNHLDEAYWYARAAVEKSPSYVVAYNTLGVVYQRHGQMAQAEKVYKRALEREREDVIVMHNLVPVLASLGKTEESKALALQLSKIDPTPPFYYFQKGMKAMEERRYADAKNLFAREVKRSPYYHEFHFWLALAHWHLGEARDANSELTLAVDTSTSADATKLYSSKLAYLRSMTGEPRRRAY